MSSTCNEKGFWNPSPPTCRLGTYTKNVFVVVTSLHSVLHSFDEVDSQLIVLLN